MKTYKLFIRALLAVSLSVSLNSLIFAQKTALPQGLTESSTLEEILRWLDKTSFQEARIGLESNAPGAQPNDIPGIAVSYYEWAFFSKGFKVAKIDGCKLVLKNDDVELIHFQTKYPNPAEGSLAKFRQVRNNQTQFTGEFSLPLKILKANKPPYRHTKKAEKADLLGTWRTEFKLTFDFDFFIIPSKANIKKLLENAMSMEITGDGLNGQSSKMTGDELTFTFDDKQMSEDFYAAFRRALTLCKDK